MERGRHEMMNAGVSHKPPIHIIFHPAETHICGRWEIAHVQPEGDVLQSCALDLVQRARVPEAQRILHHVVLGCPWVYGQQLALVCSDDHVVLVHADDGGAHAVHKPNFLVQILGQDNVGTLVDGDLEWHFGHHIAFVPVCHVAFRVRWQNGEGHHVVEEHLHSQVIEVCCGLAADGQEHGLRSLRQDVLDILQAWRLVHDVACPAQRRCFVPCFDRLQLCLGWFVREKHLQGLAQLGALAALHGVELLLFYHDIVPPGRIPGAGFLHAGQLVEVAHEDQRWKPLCSLPLFHDSLEICSGQLANFFHNHKVVGQHNLKGFMDRLVHQERTVRERGSQASRQTDKAAKKDRNRGPERTGKRKDRKRPEDGPEEDRKQKPGKDRNRFPDPGPEDRNRTGRGKTAGPEEDRNNCI